MESSSSTSNRKSRATPAAFLCVFQGMQTKDPSEPSSDYELAVARGFEEEMRGFCVFSRCEAPPVRVSRDGSSWRYWMDYSPLAGEEYANTSNVERPAEGLRELMQLTPELFAFLERMKHAAVPGVLVGVSNGATVTGEVALWMADQRQDAAPVLLLLLSGLPARDTVPRLAEELPGRALLTVGDRDHYFRGPSTYYSIAAKLHADVAAFRGGHCQETARLCEHLGRSVARKLHEMLLPERFSSKRRVTQKQPSSSSRVLSAASPAEASS